MYFCENVLVQIEVMASFLDLVLGGTRVMLLIRATGCLFESLEYASRLRALEGRRVSSKSLARVPDLD